MSSPDNTKSAGISGYFETAVAHEVSALVLLQLLFHDDVLCVEAVSLSWRLVQGLSTNAHDFWPALKGFISMTFHHQLLQLTDSQARTLVTTLRQVIENDSLGHGGIHIELFF